MSLDRVRWAPPSIGCTRADEDLTVSNEVHRNRRFCDAQLENQMLAELVPIKLKRGCGRSVLEDPLFELAHVRILTLGPASKLSTIFLVQGIFHALVFTMVRNAQEQVSARRIGK